MNIFCKPNSKKDPENSSMSAQSGVEDMKRFKSAFLNHSFEVKKQVRSCVNSLIGILRDREDELCQQIDQHTLNLMYFTDVNYPWAYLCEPDTSPTPNIRIQLRFIEDFRNLAEELKQYGSIKIDTITPDNLRTPHSRKQSSHPSQPPTSNSNSASNNQQSSLQRQNSPSGGGSPGNSPSNNTQSSASQKPVEFNYVNKIKNEEPKTRSSTPIRIQARQTSPESEGSVESFEVIEHSDFVGTSFQPVKTLVDGEAKPLKVEDLEGYFVDTASEDLPDTSIENTPNTSIENTPNTSMENTPDTSMENTPDTRMENTPNTSIENTPNTSIEMGIPETSIETLNKNIENLLETSIENTVSLSLENISFSSSENTCYSIENIPSLFMEYTKNTSIENIPNANLSEDKPKDPVELLKNQLKFFRENESSSEKASPCLIVKEKFAEFLCKGEQDMWLASPDKRCTGLKSNSGSENAFGGKRSLDLNPGFLTEPFPPNVFHGKTPWECFT